MIRSSLESKLYILQSTFSRPGGGKASAGQANLRSHPWWFLNQTNNRPGRRIALVGIAVVLIVGIIVYRARGTTFDWKLFLETVQHVSWGWLSVAILLMLLTYVGRAIRWEVMLRPLGRTVSIARLTSDTFIGFMAATLLGRVGEFVRPYLISVSAGVSLSSQIAAWALERLMDLMAVLLIFGVAFARVPSRGLHLSSGLSWALSVGGYVAGGSGVLCLCLFFAFRNFSESTRQRLSSALSFLPANYYISSIEMIDSFTLGVEATRDRGLLVRLAGFTGLEWALILGSYFALLRSFAATDRLTITDVVIVLAFVSFGSVFQIPGIGGGIQITSIIVLTEVYGLSLESASGIALFIWILTLAVIVPIGLACAFHRGMNWHKIKQLAVEKPAEEQQHP
ncbi:MAG TPA: lysylphosphatidylglycerol synthase transmembrane domain-containing protein [Bryobacteraceae bacterium]|nr:lysylphosphatidylglycerol synthase transmembrane domain-containing protein [Bryobacteraceae bacterium]